MKFETEIVQDEYKVMDYKISPFTVKIFQNNGANRPKNPKLAAYPQKLTTWPSHFQENFLCNLVLYQILKPCTKFHAQWNSGSDFMVIYWFYTFGGLGSTAEQIAAMADMGGFENFFSVRQWSRFSEIWIINEKHKKNEWERKQESQRRG